MELRYIVEDLSHPRLREFLKAQGISKGLLAKIKFQGGKIFVNGKEENVLYQIKIKDEIIVHVPKEKPHETVLLDETPIDILYEDRDFLVVNKPSGVASIPAQYHPNKTMANRVKNYFVKNNYENQVVHIVTRLDKDTSGVMLFAKHGLAHALLDQELRKKAVEKIYYAFVSGEVHTLKDHALIEGKITRDVTSLLKRKVDLEEGKDALTEYWLEKRNEALGKVKIKLHTGRTHQIRVHFAHIHCPLLGDELYGGAETLIKRQALHCGQLSFYHPFKKELMTFTSKFPDDIKKIERIFNE